MTSISPANRREAERRVRVLLTQAGIVTTNGGLHLEHLCESIVGLVLDATQFEAVNPVAAAVEQVTCLVCKKWVLVSNGVLNNHGQRNPKRTCVGSHQPVNWTPPADAGFDCTCFGPHRDGSCPASSGKRHNRELPLGPAPTRVVGLNSRVLHLSDLGGRGARCGSAKKGMILSNITEERDKVTCKNCRRIIDGNWGGS